MKVRVDYALLGSIEIEIDDGMIEEHGIYDEALKALYQLHDTELIENIANSDGTILGDSIDVVEVFDENYNSLWKSQNL